MKVWVIMGGMASEREVSLDSGRAVAEALIEGGHEVLAYELGEGRFVAEHSTPGFEVPDLKVSEALPGVLSASPGGSPPEGAWALRLLAAASSLRGQAEVAFLALHGDVGENGTAQALLEAVRFPYTGSGPAASALAMDKALSKRLMQALGVATPPWALIPVPPPGAEAPLSLLEETPVGGLPAVVKPNAEGSSVGITLVTEPRQWSAALALAAAPQGDQGDRASEVIVEKYIPGCELTVAILDRTVLPIVEIIPKTSFYDYQRKYGPGETEYRVPAPLPREVERTLKDDAWRLYVALGCRGMARIDFRQAPQDEPQCLELNTIPGLTTTSLVPKAARAAGITFLELLERVCRVGMRPRDHYPARGAGRKAWEEAPGDS
ncbi:MAG: D-alanine--D-alanine ligase [Candidatus Eisenbacteria sp.]|nr:D-alanine--D-alanine ligase [Candidatus Eisenbacteria bacterium]